MKVPGSQPGLTQVTSLYHGLCRNNRLSLYPIIVTCSSWLYSCMGKRFIFRAVDNVKKLSKVVLAYLLYGCCCLTHLLLFQLTFQEHTSDGDRVIPCDDHGVAPLCKRWVARACPKNQIHCR